MDSRSELVVKASRIVAGALALVAWAGPAAASGLEIPDLGTESMGQGCSTIAGPTDFSAIYYNPAGLAQQGGLRIQADSRATLHKVTFQRLQADGTNPKGFVSVSNAGGVNVTSLAPMAGFSYRFDKSPVPVTIAAGGWPYSSATGYDYPDPVELRAAGANEANIGVATPQRYSSVLSASKIYTAAAGFGAQVTDWLDVGATLQFITADFETRVAVASGIVSNEDTNFDAVISISGKQWFKPTGSFGVTAHLPEGFVVGGAFQLGAAFNAAGNLQADLTPSLTAAGAKLNGNAIDVAVNLPWTARLGVRMIRTDWEVELSGTLVGWHVLKAETITPHDITVDVLGTSTPLPTLQIEKDLKNAGSIRLGGLYRLGALHPSLNMFTARAGGLVETSAVSKEHQSLDLMNWGRGAFSLGLGTSLGALAIEASFMHYIQPDREVRDSQVVQVVALPGKQGTVVGNGDYGSTINLLSLSLKYRFD
ncbi:MAG: hypothetical protein JST92_24190 [Deltaproteobacteria bacterium]|nr:hypothetical protein [Deltaproteobacteria bacterium]